MTQKAQIRVAARNASSAAPVRQGAPRPRSQYRHCADTEPAPPVTGIAPAGLHNFARIPVFPPVQAKLSVSEPDDKYEQEADRVAGTVMRMPAPAAPAQPGEDDDDTAPAVQAKPAGPTITPWVQRQTDTDNEEEEEPVQASLQRQADTEDEEEEPVQAKSRLQRQAESADTDDEEEARNPASPSDGALQAKSSRAPAISSDLEAHLKHTQGQGQPLPESTRAYLEPRFGHDFSRVRVHADGQAARAARTINAQAFTHGQDIYFGAGFYQPHSFTGRRLLAHELTHTVQQVGAHPFVAQRAMARVETISAHVASRVSGDLVQLSPLSDELESLWLAGDKGAFFERMRNLGQSDPDVLAFIDANLNGDDLWLARNLFLYGREANWPIHLRVEREMMKGWADSGGKAEVFNILRAANGAQAGNADLTTSLSGVFAAGSDYLWLAQNLLAYGPESNWPIPVLIPPASVVGEQVDFTASHALASYGGDPKVNPRWTRGSADHAVAYTRNASPVLNSRFVVGNNLSRAHIPAVSVRAKEGATVLGASGPIAPGATNIDITGLILSGLSGSTDVRTSNYHLMWEASVNGGTTWGPITTTGVHPVYWLHAAPQTAPLYNFAVSKATGYVAGAGNVAASIRTGLRGDVGYNPADPINANPLSVYADGIGICTDFANLLTLLAQSVGLTANSVMFWGGFQSLGRNIWVALGGMYGNINLVNVRSTNPAYNMPLAPISPLGWAFNYHAISRIGGVLHDAALDIQGIDAQAVHDGKVVRLVEPATAALPPGTRGTAYGHHIGRRGHTVGIAVRDYGARITSANFSDVYPVVYPPAAASPYDVPVVWSVVAGSLPAGLVLDSATGNISGTPAATGTSVMSIQVRTPGGFVHTFPMSITVNP